MMERNHITRTIIASAVLFSFNAVTATSYFEVHNDTVGDIGVASSHYGVAPLANPASLIKHNSNDDFNFLLPSVGAQVVDPDDVSNEADGVKDDWDLFNNAVDNQHGVQQAAADLKHRLQESRNISADAQIDVSVVAAMANDTLPLILMLKSYGTVSVNGEIGDTDLDYLDEVASGTTTDADKNVLTSHAFGHAAVITDVGVSFTKEPEAARQKRSLGATSKYQRVDPFNYNVMVRDCGKDDSDGDKYHNTRSGFNADTGAYTGLSDNQIVGLVAQNVIPHSIDTKVVNGFKEAFRVRPQATAGVSWHDDLSITTLDANLALASGFTSDSKHQFVSVGAEFNAWKWVQLRADYRQDMALNSGSAFTAGVGISPFDVVRVDVSGLVGTDHDYGAMTQLQSTF